VVLDPNRFIANLVVSQTRLQYLGVGMSRKDP
jgi:hypothetical protein